MSSEMLKAAWREFSQRAVAAQEGAKPFYAEKSVDTHRIDLGLLPGTRLLVLVRDPRDTFVSIEAFNAQRGRAAFGREDLGDEEFVGAFIERHRQRMSWVSSLPEAPLTVRYEDLVADPVGVARTISESFPIRFDDAKVLAAREPAKPEHVTASSTAASVGRWRSELDPAIEARIRTELRGELERLGYES
jgi:hypothetical protein